MLKRKLSKSLSPKVLCKNILFPFSWPQDFDKLLVMRKSLTFCRVLLERLQTRPLMENKVARHALQVCISLLQTGLFLVFNVVRRKLLRSLPCYSQSIKATTMRLRGFIARPKILPLRFVTWNCGVEMTSLFPNNRRLGSTVFDFVFLKTS